MDPHPTRRLLFGLLCAALAAPPVAADLLPAGHRAVRHELVLEAGPLLDGWTLVATPVAGFSGVTVIEPGVPFTFSSKYGTRVHALSAGVPVPDAPEDVRSAAQASGDLPVFEVTSTPLVSPLAAVVTTLRLVAIRDGQVELEVVGERRLDLAGNPLSITLLVAGLGVVAAAGVGLAVLLQRRARRQA